MKIDLKKIPGSYGFRRTDYGKSKGEQWVEYTMGSPSSGDDSGIRADVMLDEKTGTLKINFIGYDFKHSMGDETDFIEGAVNVRVDSQLETTKIVRKALGEADMHLGWV